MQLTYELYNPATGQAEARQTMTAAEARESNEIQREKGSAARWLWQGRDVMNLDAELKQFAADVKAGKA